MCLCVCLWVGLFVVFQMALGIDVWVYPCVRECVMVGGDMQVCGVCR